MISSGTIDQYKRSRGWTDKHLVCHAPFVNLNFEQNGNITACCYNRKEVLGKYPDQSILEAWYGQGAEALRALIRENRLEGGCSACGELLEAGNYKGVKALTYDEFASPAWFSVAKDASKGKPALPKVLELEISNVCNLECSMCNGYFSSTIRKNREGLTPLPMVYDQAFVEQVKALMPGLTDLKFLGGEPFLIDLYYDIWEAIPEINPKIRVHITTNGTVLNQRAKNILKKLKVGIVISLDSVDPVHYAAIRKGGNFQKVMENVAFFKELTRKNRTYLSIAACAMNNNWKDFPALLDYCNRESFKLHFNTVWTPQELSLQSLPKEELKEIIATLEAQIPASPPLWEIQKRRNIAAYKDLISTLRFWWSEKFRRKRFDKDATKAQNTFVDVPRDFRIDSELSPVLLRFLCALLSKDAAEGADVPEGLSSYLKMEAGNLPDLQQMAADEFNDLFCETLLALNEANFSEGKNMAAFDSKVSVIKAAGANYQEALKHQFLSRPLLVQLAFIQMLKREEIEKSIAASLS
jgi:MoaA/NifB/PqqE/SkfB family radical SAM enzyme